MANTKRVQFRRGTNAEHATFTGASGELTVNTTNQSVHVHDGTTVRGFELLRRDFANSVSGTINGSLGVSDFLTVSNYVSFGSSLSVTGRVGFSSDLIVNKGISAKTGILSALNVAGISTLESAIISGLSYPTLDGQPGQALVTDGAGNITFGAGGSSSESRIKVSANEGNDDNDGKILPVATIKRALQLASQRLQNNTPSRFIDGANLLKLNKEFIKAEVVAYIEATTSIESNLDYNAVTCARDVGYIVDAIVHDLKYGGNSKTVDAALAYWDGAVNAVAGEVTETVAAFQYIVTISRYIINNLPVPTTYQLVQSQVYDLNVPYDAAINRNAYDEFSCANVLSAIGSYVGIITSVISNGVGSAPSKSYPQPETLDAVTVFVEGGDYVEDNPLLVADGVSIVGDSLRNTIIRPLNAGKDLFRVRNGCYMANISMKDYVVNGVPQHTFSYAIAFDDPFDSLTPRVGYAGSVLNVVSAFYNNTTGITTITVDGEHQLIKGQTVRLSGLGFTCSYDSGITTFFYPEANASGQLDFDVVSVGSPVEFTIQAGITTVQHFYAGGGTAGLGKAKITQSPYVQNCSILSFIGANGVLVDGSKIQDNNIPAIQEEAERPAVGDVPTFGKSMVANAFTMVSFGGIGWRTINDGYAQVVSCFQIFCRYGSLAQSGGYLSITNSATNFGLYALRSTGFSKNSFEFDRGRIAATGISGGLQTLKVVGLGRSDQDLYILRFFNDNNVDSTSSFKPLIIEEQFNVSTAVNTTTDIITIPGHPFTNGESLLYIGNEDASPQQVIDGLVSGNQYYVGYIDASTFKLYEDDSLTRLVSLGSTFVGINTFIKNNQDFYSYEIIEAHNQYQKVSLASTTASLNFISGRQVSQTVTGGVAVGIALTYIPATRDLIVSVEEVSGVRNYFSGISTFKIQDHSPSPVSIGVTAVAGISSYYTVVTKVESTIAGNVIPDIGDLPETYKCHFHRPSIVNSSSHTWEYSGSGTDYNALPQNGGKTIPATEQVSEQGGRVYSSGTNELGDFKIGKFITAFNRTGNIIFNNKVTIGQLDSLRLSLSNGVIIEEFSTDTNLGETEIGGPLNRRVSTQLAVRTFLNNRLGDFIDQNLSTSAIPNAVVKLNAAGQINAELIPPKVVNFITVNTIGGRTSLVNYIPAKNIKQGDTVAEPENSYVLIQDTVQEYLILDSSTRNYNFLNGDTVISSLSQGSSVGIVTAPTSVAYGTTGLVKGVLIKLGTLTGGSGYLTSGIYTGVALNSTTGIGTSAIATITVSAAGTVSNVAIDTGGRYYASGDILTVNNPALIGGRSGGSNFTVAVSQVETRLYLKLSNNQKFPGTIVLPDYIADRDAVAISTSITVGIGRTFDPTDYSTGGSVDFFNNRIIVDQSNFENGDPVVYSNGGGNTIGGLTNGNTYYIKKVGISSVEFHNTYALSSAVSLTSNGTGTHRFDRFPINESKDTVIFVNHGFTTGDSIRVSDDTPTGITTGNFYYVGSATTNSFTFHTTQSDATQSSNGITLNPVGISSIGIGTTLTITKQNVRYSETINTSSALESNWSLLAKSDIDAANIISGTISPSRLGSGSATQDTFLAGNSSYQKVIKSVGIGTTEPISITATSFDSAPNGVGVNTYYGDLNITLNRVATSADTYSSVGVARFKTSTFSIGADGQVSIKNSSTGDVDAATLGSQSPSYYLNPANLSTVVGISKGGTGLSATPANGAILIGNGSAYNQTIHPTFTGNVVFSNGITISSGVVTATSFTSNVATGTAPLIVSSQTQVSNLNASLLEGYATATLNTASTIVRRDTVGGFNAGIITATSFSGNLANTLTLNTSGTGLSGSTTFNNSGAATFTVTSNATSDATNSAIVSRDTIGGFAAGIVTATRYVSTVATGTAPLTVSSTTVVANLNASFLEGYSTATTNTASSIVLRNTIGGFAAGIITATSFSGNLANTLTLNTSGTGLSGSTTFNNSGAATFTVTSNATSNATNSAIVARNTIGGFAAGIVTATSFSGNLANTLTLNTSGTGLSGSTTFNNSGAATFTVTSNATSDATNSAIVSRNTIGGFAAGIVTATSFSGGSISGSTGSFTGQVTSTLANNTTTGGGQIYLNGATGNRIDFNQNGVAAPAFTTRSAGTKLVLYPAIAASSADYAFGIDSSTLWRSVPTTSDSHKWYGGTTLAATLTGAGAFTAVGAISGTTLTSTVVTGTAPLTVSSTTKVTNLNADFLDDKSVGTSGNVIPLLDGANTWSNTQTFTANISMSSSAAERQIAFSNGTTNVYFYGQTVAGGGNIGMFDGTNSRNVWVYNVAAAAFNPALNTNVTGAITATGNITAYSSDRRLKENFKHLGSAVERVQKLNGYTFDWNKTSEELNFVPKHKTNDIGLIAQEVEAVLPQAVDLAPFDRDYDENGNIISKSGENYLTIQYERLVPLLVEAIKEQQQEINNLKNKINDLRN